MTVLIYLAIGLIISIGGALVTGLKVREIAVYVTMYLLTMWMCIEQPDSQPFRQFLANL